MAQTMCGLAFALPSASLRLILISLPLSRGGKAHYSRWLQETRKYTPFLSRLAGWWNAGSSNAGGQAAVPALGLGCRALLPVPHRRRRRGGGRARGLLSQGWPSLFDKLIARRGLADPGVTPVTTKVELEEIRLKERRKKKN